MLPAVLSYGLSRPNDRDLSIVSLGWSLVFLFIFLTRGDNIIDKIVRIVYWIAAKTFFRGLYEMCC